MVVVVFEDSDVASVLRLWLAWLVVTGDAQGARPVYPSRYPLARTADQAADGTKWGKESVAPLPMPDAAALRDSCANSGAHAVAFVCV